MFRFFLRALHGTRLGEDTGPPLREAMEQFERQYILRVLEGTGWNVSRAARRLGVHRNTVLTKLSGWGIQRPTTGDVTYPHGP